MKTLISSLVEWVRSNGLAFNLKKTKYMIFSRSRLIDLPSPLIICETAIERKHEARFLGVIIDESLNWSRHIQTVLSKMSRYIGIMYKIKKYLPLKARIQIYHSFVQSHLNYCSLVWGFTCKSNIETLFSRQKRDCVQSFPVLLTINTETARLRATQNRIFQSTKFSQFMGL